MLAAVISRQGRPVAPNLRIESDPAFDPGQPGPGEVRVRTLATALNHLDLWVGGGVPGIDLTYPRISGCDACGEIAAVGQGVPDAWIGTRVVFNAAVPQPDPLGPAPGSTSPGAPAYQLIGEHTNGTHRAAFVCPVAAVAAIASDADPTEAAAFGLVTLTAYSMMLGKAHLRPGQTVLITGIGGGVANAALAIANWMGCPAIVTSRHQWKLDRAKELGAAHGVLDTGDDWSRQVRKLTDKRGVDLAVDSAGKATHLNCIKSMARGAAYVTPGCTTGPDATTDLARVFWNQLRIFGSTMGTAAEFSEITALFNAGKLRVPVDRVFPAREAEQAFAHLEAGEQMGKVVLDWR